MVVTYDPSIEGQYLPTVPLGNRTPDNHKQIIRETMTKMLTRMRYQQDTAYKTGDPDTDRAWINSLKLLKKWSSAGAPAPTHQEDNQFKYVVKTTDFIEDLKKARIVLWAEMDDGEKVYYNFKSIPEEKLPNIFDILSGRELMEDDYQGKNSEAIAGRPMKKVGISFFRYQNKNLRKVPQQPLGQEIDIEVYRKHRGGFFAYVPLIPVHLEKFGIFNTINKRNYKDNCFIQACIQSNVLTPEEIDALRSFIRTKEVPRAKVREIADFIKCNFYVKYLDETKTSTKHQIEYYMNTTKGKNGKDYGRMIEMLLFRDHYMINDTVKMTPYYIEHYEDIQKQFPKMPVEEQMLIINAKGEKTTSKGYKLPQILMTLVKCNRLRPIYKFETDIIATREYDDANLVEYQSLEYDEKLCCELVEDNKLAKEYSHVMYADFESDITVNPHKAYLCCCVWRNEEGKGFKQVFRGYHCAIEFLDWVPNNSLIYFHNLKYDASFFINSSLGTYNINMIEHAGKMMMLKFRQLKGGSKQFTIKDSYSIISAPLRAFGSMFNLEVHKEVCPYTIYNQANLQRKFVPLDECLACLADEDKQAFVDNCKQIKCLHLPNNTIDILYYAEFYCVKDCIVLMRGMEKFDEDLAKIFATNNKKWIGVESYLSISAIGYDFTIKYGCLEGVYALAGKPQDFISRCVSGGRTMCANNEKQLIEECLQDFDAVSLYPSAMSIMPGIPLGKPKVIKTCERDTIMKYDAFFVEINVKSLQAKGVDKYRFPLVFTNINGTKIFEDIPINSFYVDKRGLMDLEQFYDIEYEVVRGYYFDEGFNSKINDLIKILFDLRAKYKKEGNPLQQTIKLLLNSIYGKSILKPIKTDTKIIAPEKLQHFINLNYNYIKEIHELPGKKVNIYAKMIKPINHHFNVPQFGVGVLSWSKHIMNEVMCLADQKGLPVYYQDTDSLHIGEADVPKLQAYFKEAYGRELIGKNLCQFHCDFDPIKEGVPVHSKKLIALGKKCYVDLLEDDEGNTSYHIRMKGIPQAVIEREAEKRGITIEDLYMLMYNGEEINFNLLDGSNCFRKNDFYQMETPLAFSRKIKF